MPDSTGAWSKGVSYNYNVQVTVLMLVCRYFIACPVLISNQSQNFIFYNTRPLALRLRAINQESSRENDIVE